MFDDIDLEEWEIEVAEKVLMQLDRLREDPDSEYEGEVYGNDLEDAFRSEFESNDEFYEWFIEEARTGKFKGSVTLKSIPCKVNYTADPDNNKIKITKYEDL